MIKVGDIFTKGTREYEVYKITPMNVVVRRIGTKLYEEMPKRHLLECSLYQRKEK